MGARRSVCFSAAGLPQPWVHPHGTGDALIQPGHRGFTASLAEYYGDGTMISQGWCGDKGDISSGDEGVWGGNAALLNPKC